MRLPMQQVAADVNSHHGRQNYRDPIAGRS